MLPAKHNLMTCARAFMVCQAIADVDVLVIELLVHLRDLIKNDDIKKLDPKEPHLVDLQQLTTENRIKS